jgi:hypothetical protein
MIGFVECSNHVIVAFSFSFLYCLVSGFVECSNHVMFRFQTQIIMHYIVCYQ